MINIENLTKSYTERKLFVSVAFPLQEGEKVGGTVSYTHLTLPTN